MAKEKNKFVACGDMILQDCGFTRSKKTLQKRSADIIGFVNQFQVMDWSTHTHKCMQRSCWKVISESHVTLSTLWMEWSSEPSSPQIMSHLLQHCDDLIDSASHRLMTYSYRSIRNLTIHLCFSPFENCFNQQPRLQRAGRGCIFVYWIWLLQSDVSIIKKQNI